MSEQAKDFLVWVGGASYSRESMVEEAQKMGVCRRIPFVPEGLVRGVSRIFLISDMSDEDRERYKGEIKRRDAVRYKQWKESGFKNISSHVTGAMPRGTPTIFAYFLVRNITYVVAPGVDIPRRLKGLGVTEYQYVEGGFGFNDERDCGSLMVGGTYLLSEEDMEKVKELAQSGTLDGRIVMLPTVYPYADKRFRGIKAVNRKVGERLMGGAG